MNPGDLTDAAQAAAPVLGGHAMSLGTTLATTVASLYTRPGPAASRPARQDGGRLPDGTSRAADKSA